MSHRKRSVTLGEPLWDEVSRREFLLWGGWAGMVALTSPENHFMTWFSNSLATSHQSGYEYIAGEVILPFKYSATVSPAPKPTGLNFSGQINPDNCQVFVRIEDELWEFR